MRQRLLIYIIISLSLFYHCGVGKKADLIGVYYKAVNPYNEKEILRNLSQIAFKNNHTLIKRSYKKNPKYNIIKEFHKKKVKIIIFEGFHLKDISKITRYAHQKKILLSLITDKPAAGAHILNITDYKKLGYDMASQLYQFSRRKRDQFVILYKNNFSDYYYKKELLKGYSQFFVAHPELKITTNTYNQTNKEYLILKLNHIISTYPNNLRGIITDDDAVAVLMGNSIRRKRQDNKIKISGLHTSLEGVDSIMKTLIAVTGDINRYQLFHTALSNALINYTNIINAQTTQTNLLNGIYYNQINILDKLAPAKKFSIKQIIQNQ